MEDILMIKASDFGFFPGNTPEKNSAALQMAADIGGEIFVDGKGIADVVFPMMVGNDTTVIFEDGLFLRRNDSGKEHNGYTIVNRGAFTKTWNRNIKILGLKLICNNVICKGEGVQSDKCVPGLRGQIAFHYVKNLEIRDFTVRDLPKFDYCIHVCTFENVLVENAYIEGLKDGVHFGGGKNFVVRNCKFRTLDDAVALNAHDYSSGNPELGWIENGLIENCEDLSCKQIGFFSRILAGSWLNWREGMMIRHSDTVVHDGRIYRAYMQADGKEYISVTPPTHTEGTVTLDGEIAWVMVQEGTHLNVGCCNITFRNITLESNRHTGFKLHFDNEAPSHSVYPGSVLPVQENITFENIKVTSREMKCLMRSNTPIKNVIMKNCDLAHTRMVIYRVDVPDVCYVKGDITLENLTYMPAEEKPMLLVENGLDIDVIYKNN